jgi:hypothetical protein
MCASSTSVLVVVSILDACRLRTKRATVANRLRRLARATPLRGAFLFEVTAPAATRGETAGARAPESSHEFCGVAGTAGPRCRLNHLAGLRARDMANDLPQNGNTVATPFCLRLSSIRVTDNLVACQNAYRVDCSQRVPFALPQPVKWP